MKTLLFIILLILSLSSCDVKTPIKKPFIITDKSRFTPRSSDYWRFEYIDATGRDYTFCDENKYNIGDTIK